MTFSYTASGTAITVDGSLSKNSVDGCREALLPDSSEDDEGGDVI